MSKAWRQLPCRWGAIATLGLCAATAAWGQDINSSPNAVGSGARALGMGGAFIAVADDATAASWNPGGLTQLERPEISIVHSWKWFGEDLTTTSFINPHGEERVSTKDLNYLSIVYPFRRTLGGRNMVVSLNLQHKYDFARQLNFRARYPFSNIHVNVDFDQKGSLSALSPAFGVELTGRLSVGLAVNLWDSALIPNNKWHSRTKRRILFPGQVFYNNTYEHYDDFEGVNYTFGALYKPTARLSLGAVYHTTFAADVHYTRRNTTYGLWSTYHRTKMRIEFPSAAGLGVAYRFPNDKLTLSLDVTRREWDQFVQIDPRARLRNYWYGPFSTYTPGTYLAGRRIDPITGLPKWRSPHDPTYTVRLGAEYVFLDQTKPIQNYLPSIRAGLFYDPEPANGRSDHLWWVKDGSGAPDDYYGVTIGGGVLIKNRVNIDALYQYRWGTNVRKDTLRVPQNLMEKGFDIDVAQHAFYVSTVIYF